MIDIPSYPRSLSLRLMTEADLPLLRRWFQQPHIMEWWGGEDAMLSLEEIRGRYHPQVMAEEGVTPYIAIWRGEPLGYAQSYIALGAGDGWWMNETDPGVRGIDQFIGQVELLGKGLGTELVRLLVEHLFNDPAVTKIQTDPDPGNTRAIRCYEKAGFVRRGIVQTPDGPALYMVQSRPTLHAGP